MFSEYASRFLAQSQSRFNLRQPDDTNRSRLDRLRRRDGNSSRTGNNQSRYFSRIGGGGGGGAPLGPFAFASRGANPQAPLFYSAADDFREEDDETEHEREVADFYALQRSRRHFVNHPLEESSEAEGENASHGSGLGDSADGRDGDARGFGGGIRSSWRGDGQRTKRTSALSAAAAAAAAQSHRLERVSSEASAPSQLYDVGLASTIRDGVDQDEPPDDLAVEQPESDDGLAPAKDHSPQKSPDPAPPYRTRQTDFLGRRDSRDSEDSSVPPTVGGMTPDPPRHDAFWANLYVIALLAFFSSFVLVWLHTAIPTKSMGDTVYNTIHRSFYLLAVDTLVAVIVSLVWLALLRAYVRPLVYLILAVVPIILFSFTLYPFISSFQSKEHTSNLQDTMMRWLSSLPALAAVFWVYAVWRGRYSLGRSIAMLEFACKILAANPELLIVGFGTLAAVVLWTWLWMAIFARVFLGGHLVGRLFIIDVGTWWLAAAYILVYLWTLGVQGGIQRATTAATVSQWYFHRFADPAPTSRQVVQAALGHALQAAFGTICLSALTALLVRLPVLVLPRRILTLVGICSYNLMPNSLLLLTHPTTLSYAAIHSQPLAASARAVSQLNFSHRGSPAMRMGRMQRTSEISRTSSVRPHQIALLLLHATRLVTSLAFGFGAWVQTAATTADHRGSLYAYIVGLVASAIGWAVLGAMENVLTGIVDAVVVCWANEVRNGEVKYCREADAILGDGDPLAEDRAGLLGR